MAGLDPAIPIGASVCGGPRVKPGDDGGRFMVFVMNPLSRRVSNV